MKGDGKLQESMLLCEYIKRQLECLITLGPIILWRQRCHAAIASIQALLSRHLSEEVALTALAIVMSRQIVAIVIVTVIVAGRCLLFLRARCGSTGDDVASHERHELNGIDFFGVHFFGILILQHFLDDIQTQGARGRYAEIMIEGKILALARSEGNEQLDGGFGYVTCLAIENVW